MPQLIDRPPDDWFRRVGAGSAFPSNNGASIGPATDVAELARLLAAGQQIGGFPIPPIAPGGSSSGSGSQLGDLGTTLGAVVGQAALPIPGVGAFVGATLGNVVAGGISKVFCFAPGTSVRMADGSSRPIETLRPGMATAGGIVCAAYAHPGRGQAVYRYGQVLVTGAHAVLEAGRWLRVRDSARAQALPDVTLPRVHNLVTREHRIFIDDHCFADAAETDADLEDLDESLAALAAA